MAIATITAPTRGTYNGKPTLSLPGPTEGSKPITFGVARWREIMKPANQKAVQDFLAEHPPKSAEVSDVIAKLKASGLSAAEILEQLTK